MCTNTISKQNKFMEQTLVKSYDDIHNTFIVPCEKSRIVSFVSSIMKKIVVCPALSRLLLKLICCIAF